MCRDRVKYFDQRGRSSASLEAPRESTKVASYTVIDATRFLLGDEDGAQASPSSRSAPRLTRLAAGRISLLAVSTDGNRVADVQLRVLGTTPPASAIAYLDNAFVFVGSAGGDSALVKLNPNSTIEVRAYRAYCGDVIGPSIIAEAAALTMCIADRSHVRERGPHRGHGGHGSRPAGPGPSAGRRAEKECARSPAALTSTL